MRRLVQLGFALLVACSSAPPAPAPREPGPVRTWSPGPLSTDGDYPSRYPIVADVELARRTNVAMAAAPGWHVVLDALGFLSTATCSDACPGAADNALSPADQAHVEEFISKNDAILAANAAGVAMKTPNAEVVNYTQTGPYGSVTTMRVSRNRAGLTITQHLWPRLPTAEAKPEADIERALRRLEADPDLIIRRGYRTTSETMKGPVELRLAACLARASEDAVPFHERPRHPCVDAHTGEDITSHLCGVHVTVKDGVITKRGLNRPYKD